MNGQMFDPANKQGGMVPSKPKDWFSYPVLFLALADNATPSTNIQIDAGSDFYLTAITYFAVVDSATAGVSVSSQPVPAVTVLLTDTGSNRQLMNNPAPLASIAGDGNHPHRLIHPRLFLRNSNIQIVLRSYDATTYSELWINFEGFRIYG